MTAHDSSPSSADVGVVVVNFGPPTLLQHNLVALAESDDAGGLEVVVVDNFSGAENRRAVRRLVEARDWTGVYPPDNSGFGGGANLGARAAIENGCSHLLFLNPDVSIQAPDVRALASSATRALGSLVSPVIHRPDGSIWFAGGNIDLRDGSTDTRPGSSGPMRQRWLTGACLMVDAAQWRELGGFDERYFMYWEDIDLSQRCIAAGGSLIVDSDVTVVHDVGGTQKSGGDGSASSQKSNLYTYYVNRNRLLFASIHIANRDRWRWLVATPREAVAVASRTGRRNAVSRPSYLWATVRGTLAGVRLLVRSTCRSVRGRQS